MTKSELIQVVAERLPHLPRKDVEAAIKAVFSGMTETLSNEERIEIRGFGSFTVRVRRSREGRNPKTGERVMVPTRRSALFAAGKELRERINGREDVQKAGGEAA